MTTSREQVKKTIRFAHPERLVGSLPEPYGTDFAGVGLSPSPDDRPPGGVGTDEWGSVWRNIGVCRLGEVQTPALPDWAGFEQLRIPDITEAHRWTPLEGARDRAGDKFLIGAGISLYERAHFIRGLQNLWTDIHLEPERLTRLLGILVEMNLEAIRRYAAADVDGYMFCDDWGLQHTLMIDPDAWRALWKPRYARVYGAAHEAGLLTLLHSCGHIVDIMDDLIETGLDVIQMDQQENMGLELLGKRFGGRIAFWCPVDIQKTMAHGSLDEIRAYCRRMARVLGRPEGGFIAGYYADPQGAGHRQEAIDAMCQEFMAISGEITAAG